MRYRRWILSFVLAILIVLLLLLVYLYFALVRAPTRVQVARVKGITHVLSIYGFGTKPEELLKNPTGVATDNGGRIFVSDTPNQRVLIFDRRGKYLGQLGSAGSAQGQFARPEGVDVGANGDIYVSDPIRNTVIVFGSNLNFKAEIPEERPMVVYDTGAKIYVLAADHVSIYNEKLNLLTRWGNRGPEIGQFDFPHGIAVLKDGNMVVSDGNNMRLLAYRKDTNRALWVVGKRPQGLSPAIRTFGLPGGLTTDRDENLYLVDPLRHTIHIYNKQGKKVAEYGEQGAADGQFSYPTDIAYLGGNTFVLSDTMNNRLQIIRISLP